MELKGSITLVNTPEGISNRSGNEAQDTGKRNLTQILGPRDSSLFLRHAKQKLAHSFLLRIWRTAIRCRDPGAPFEQLFAGIIFVDYHLDEAQAILVRPCGCFDRFY